MVLNHFKAVKLLPFINCLCFCSFVSLADTVILPSRRFELTSETSKVDLVVSLTFVEVKMADLKVVTLLEIVTFFRSWSLQKRNRRFSAV